MERKFEVGDLVRVKSGLVMGKLSAEGPYINRDMTQMCGREMVIREVLGDGLYHYRLKDTPWAWCEDWLKPVDVSSRVTVAKRKLVEAEKALADARAVVEKRQATLEALLKVPPEPGDVFWNGSTDSTKVSIVAVVGDRLWYDNTGNKTLRGFIQPIDYFYKIGYERYVP